MSWAETAALTKQSLQAQRRAAKGGAWQPGRLIAGTAEDGEGRAKGQVPGMSGWPVRRRRIIIARVGGLID
jgi:hypothetical protein